MTSADRRRVLHVRDGVARWVPDRVAAEEPLQIVVDGVLASTTMRTPGHDVDLALGWLVSEGVIARSGDVGAARACFEEADDDEVRRSVQVTTTHQRPVTPRLHGTSSACGVCGGDVVRMALTARGTTADIDDVRIDVGALLAMPDQMREAQRGFHASGGLHAAALFTPAGEVRCVREDVGRHNAVDKVVGWALTEGLLPLRGHALQVSGRASAELAHKCITAGIPVLAAVSAPTTLAVDLARAAGLTLVGFVRGGGLNVYAGAERITGLPRT